MFNSFYLFLSILGCNVDSSLVSNSNAYNLNLESCSNVRIYIRMLKECVFSTCSWKMAFSDDVGKKISQLHEELVNAYKKKLLLRGGEGRGCCLCWTWRNARGFSWTNVAKRNGGWWGGGGIGGSKKPILAWCNYWLAPEKERSSLRCCCESKNYHSCKKVVNNVYRSWVTLVSSVLPNAINYFIFKNFLRRVIYFSCKNIWEWMILELVLLNYWNLVFSNSQRCL